MSQRNLVGAHNDGITQSSMEGTKAQHPVQILMRRMRVEVWKTSRPRWNATASYARVFMTPAVERSNANMRVQLSAL